MLALRHTLTNPPLRDFLMTPRGTLHREVTKITLLATWRGEGTSPRHWLEPAYKLLQPDAYSWKAVCAIKNSNALTTDILKPTIRLNWAWGKTQSPQPTPYRFWLPQYTFVYLVSTLASQVMFLPQNEDMNTTKLRKCTIQNQRKLFHMFTTKGKCASVLKSAPCHALPHPVFGNFWVVGEDDEGVLKRLKLERLTCKASCSSWWFKLQKRCAKQTSSQTPSLGYHEFKFQWYHSIHGQESKSTTVHALG